MLHPLVTRFVALTVRCNLVPQFLSPDFHFFFCQSCNYSIVPTDPFFLERFYKLSPTIVNRAWSHRFSSFASPTIFGVTLLAPQARFKRSELPLCYHTMSAALTDHIGLPRRGSRSLVVNGCLFIEAHESVEAGVTTKAAKRANSEGSKKVAFNCATATRTNSLGTFAIRASAFRRHVRLPMERQRVWANRERWRIPSPSPRKAFSVRSRMIAASWNRINTGNYVSQGAR
jgi:hypothetical protein